MTLQVHLIHGTWANWKLKNFPKKPRWFESGHAFRDQLEAISKECHSVEVRQFTWGWGANLHRRRLRAARKLAAIVDQSPVESRHIFIGHSHGGNVAIMAARIAERPEKICNILTLSTPFIVFSRSDYIRRVGVFFGQFLAVVYGIVSAFIVMDGFLANIGFTIWTKIASAMLVFGLFYLAMLVDRGERDYEAKVEEAGLYGEIPNRIKVTAIRTIGDEASGILQFLAPVNFLVNRLFGWIIPSWKSIAKRLILISMAVAVPALFVIVFLKSPWVVRDIAFLAILILPLILIAEFILIFALSMILYILRLPFGWDFLFSAMRFSLTVESSLPGESLVFMPPADHQANTLSHSQVYENDLVKQEVRRIVIDVASSPDKSCKL